MLKFRDDIQIPVVCKVDEDGACDIYVPDLEMTLHGKDFVDALASCSLKVSAIYYYNLERNIKLEFKATYQEAEAMCDKRSFVTFACISD